jgi:hypothetical protein
MDRGAGGATKTDWEAAGRFLGKIGKASTFWIGDWHIAGVSAGFTRGDLYDEAEKITGLDRGTLYNAVNLAKSVHAGVRRTDVSPSHHMEVAALNSIQQKKLLDQAATNHWTRRQLRDVVQDKLPKPLQAPTPEKVILGEELIAWTDKARKYDEFKEVVAAVDRLFTTGSRTIFPK